MKGFLVQAVFSLAIFKKFCESFILSQMLGDYILAASDLTHLFKTIEKTHLLLPGNTLKSIIIKFGISHILVQLWR